MKSFCIKNNNVIILDYLLTEFQKLDLNDTYVSRNTFKLYDNVIIHYKGKNELLFIEKIAWVLTDCIIRFYESNVIKRVINSDFFYFNASERKIIYENCLEILNSSETNEFEKRRENIFMCLCEYISENKFFILDGFVNFRLFEYNNLVEECVDMAVNKYVIDKEYKEFITLLQSYIESQNCRTGTVHLIYSNGEPILLDENQHVLVYDTQFEQHKYLSDISFSTKDYCLNALLNLLPKRIIVHMIAEEDEFVNTLSLIFGIRLMICKECDICKTFSRLGKAIF